MFSPCINVVKLSTQDYTIQMNKRRRKKKKNNIEIGCIIVQATYIFLGPIFHLMSIVSPEIIELAFYSWIIFVLIFPIITGFWLCKLLNISYSPPTEDNIHCRGILNLCTYNLDNHIFSWHYNDPCIEKNLWILPPWLRGCNRSQG